MNSRDNTTRIAGRRIVVVTASLAMWVSLSIVFLFFAQGVVPEVEPDQPDAAWAFRARSWKDDLGRIDPDGLMKAKRQLKAMKDRRAAANAPASGAAWAPLGPGNVGGRVRSIAFHPVDHNVVFAASVTGGICRTADSGASWAPVDDFMANLGVTSIVFVPTH